MKKIRQLGLSLRLMAGLCMYGGAVYASENFSEIEIEECLKHKFTVQPCKGELPASDNPKRYLKIFYFGDTEVHQETEQMLKRLKDQRTEGKEEQSSQEELTSQEEQSPQEELASQEGLASERELDPQEELASQEGLVSERELDPLAALCINLSAKPITNLESVSNQTLELIEQAINTTKQAEKLQKIGQSLYKELGEKKRKFDELIKEHKEVYKVYEDENQELKKTYEEHEELKKEHKKLKKEHEEEKGKLITESDKIKQEKEKLAETIDILNSQLQNLNYQLQQRTADCFLHLLKSHEQREIQELKQGLEAELTKRNEIAIEFSARIGNFFKAWNIDDIGEGFTKERLRYFEGMVQKKIDTAAKEKAENIKEIEKLYIILGGSPLKMHEDIKDNVHSGLLALINLHQLKQAEQVGANKKEAELIRWMTSQPARALRIEPASEQLGMEPSSMDNTNRIQN